MPYTSPDSEHGTLVANTVATVTLTTPCTSVEVVNVDGAAAIYYTVSNAGALPANPTVLGDDTEVLPKAVTSQIHEAIGKQIPIVKLISSGTPVYAVVGRP